MTSLRELPRAVKKVVKASLDTVGLLAPISHVHLRYRQEVDRKDTLRLYRQFIRPGDLCFDVGANVGNNSDIMLSLGGRVVAVEPQEESIAALRARFRAVPEFTLVPKGLAAEVGAAEFLVCESSDCSSMSREFVEAVSESGRLNLGVCQWSEVRQVPTTTLDELIAEFGLPAFVKIDVEGFEEEVLKCCSQRLRVLSFEFTPERPHPALACVKLLEQLGPVEFNYTYQWRRRLLWPAWLSGEQLARKLTTTCSQGAMVPGGDVYARFIGS